MRLVRDSNQQILNLGEQALLAAGGEARIFQVPGDASLVAKVYHRPTPERAAKLRAMLANPPVDPMVAKHHRSIAWPLELLRPHGSPQRIVGFLMPRVSDMHRVIDFFNPKTRRQVSPCFNYFYLHRTARNLVTAVRALHERGYVFGDVNESNILVSDRALVTLVDTDSFQVWDGEKGVIYRCRVGKPEFTPPELQGRSFAELDRQPYHDLFGLAVLLFQLLMEGSHPFAGTYQAQGDPPPYEKRIALGHFPYAHSARVPYAPAPTTPSFASLHPTLQHLFVRCFQDGHLDPGLRPDTQSWQWALEEAENSLVTCWVNDQHLYGGHLEHCPWCERTKLLGGRDPFPSVASVKRGDHLKPPPRIPRRRFPDALGTSVRQPPVPRPIALPNPFPVYRPRTGRGRISTARPWHTFGWPRARNYAAWWGLIFGLFALYLQYTLPRMIGPSASFPFALGAVLCGTYGEVRSRSWELQGRGKWIARTALGLGGAGFLIYLIRIL